MIKGFAIDEPYVARFEGTLRFDTLDEAEHCIARLDALYRAFQSQNDLKGMSYCRRLAMLGKQRARAIAKNPRVGLEKRTEKDEIAGWFDIWVQTPDIFFEWLKLRKQSPEFVSKYGSP